MAMDDELRKILLREQDLRFVTDTLSSYLGKKAEERKYYADLSYKERTKEPDLMEVYDVDAGGYVLRPKTDFVDGDPYLKEPPDVGAGKPLETEGFYFNIPSVTDRTDDQNLLLKGFNIDDYNEGGIAKFDLTDSEVLKFRIFQQTDKPADDSLKRSDLTNFTFNRDVKVNDDLTYVSGETYALPADRAYEYQNMGSGSIILSNVNSSSMSKGDTLQFNEYKRMRNHVYKTLGVNIDGLGNTPISIKQSLITKYSDKFQGITDENLIYEKILKELVFPNEEEYNRYVAFENKFGHIWDINPDNGDDNNGDDNNGDDNNGDSGFQWAD